MLGSGQPRTADGVDRSGRSVRRSVATRRVRDDEAPAAMPSQRTNPARSRLPSGHRLLRILVAWLCRSRAITAARSSAVMIAGATSGTTTRSSEPLSEEKFAGRNSDTLTGYGDKWCLITVVLSRCRARRQDTDQQR